jgi:hypothetical protein
MSRTEPTIKMLSKLEYRIGFLFLVLSIYCLYRARYGDPHGIISPIWYWALSASILFFFCGAILNRSLLARVLSHAILLFIAVPLMLLVFPP